MNLLNRPKYRLKANFSSTTPPSNNWDDMFGNEDANRLRQGFKRVRNPLNETHPIGSSLRNVGKQINANKGPLTLAAGAGGLLVLNRHLQRKAKQEEEQLREELSAKGYKFSGLIPKSVTFAKQVTRVNTEQKELPEEDRVKLERLRQLEERNRAKRVRQDYDRGLNTAKQLKQLYRSGLDTSRELRSWMHWLDI